MVLADDEDMVVLELGNVLTPGSLRLLVEPLVFALVCALVVPMFMAGKMLTMVGFPSGPRETLNKNATPDVLAGLL